VIRNKICERFALPAVQNSRKKFLHLIQVTQQLRIVPQLFFSHSYAMTSFQISKSVTKSSQITGCNLNDDVISFTQDK
jgi:hypothetical protein